MKSAALLALLWLPVTLAAGNVQRVDDFGPNPAGLRMYLYVPATSPAPGALVVALHGCTQDAETYGDAGWLDLAREKRFFLLLPEQGVADHMINSCWSWYKADDDVRDSGQTRSILAMVEYVRAHHHIDAARIYVDGLSAGGWLVSDLLASYPDVFAGGAVHAGGPAYCASSRQAFWDWSGVFSNMTAGSLALGCMQGDNRTPQQWAQLARAHVPHEWQGKWPVLSIWQGSADAVVSPGNQRELMEQWTELAGADQKADFSESLGPGNSVRHERYLDGGGRAVVETWRIANMNHGIAIDGAPDAHCGESSAFVLDVGVCAVRWITLFWGL